MDLMMEEEIMTIFVESLFIPLRRDDDDDGIESGGGIGGAPIGKSDDKNGDELLVVDRNVVKNLYLV